MCDELCKQRVSPTVEFGNSGETATETRRVRFVEFEDIVRLSIIYRRFVHVKFYKRY